MFSSAKHLTADCLREAPDNIIDDIKAVIQSEEAKGCKEEQFGTEISAFSQIYGSSASVLQEVTGVSVSEENKYEEGGGEGDEEDDEEDDEDFEGLMEDPERGARGENLQESDDQEENPMKLLSAWYSLKIFRNSPS